MEVVAEVLHHRQQMLLDRMAAQVVVAAQLVLSVIMRHHLLRLRLVQEESAEAVEVEEENSLPLELVVVMEQLALLEATDK